MTNGFKRIADNIVRLGESFDGLYAAVVFGSQARENHQADEYSDLDVLMVVEDSAHFLSSDTWIKNIGEFHVSFIENAPDGNKERRVLFDNALDVDFLILPKSKVHTMETNGEIRIFAEMLLRHGYYVLIDKIGLQDILKQFDFSENIGRQLTECDFKNLVNDFWYHSVWTAKKLLRGELWTAKLCVDSYMKWKLLSIIEYHARELHGAAYNTWHSGRFIEEWAESRIIERLSVCFSHYNKEDIKRALLSTMELFRLVAVEVAEKRGFAYPREADEYAAAWVIQHMK